MSITVTAEHINAILSRSKIVVSKLGEKTCCVHVTLKNGFELVETASCVDPTYYSTDMGRRVAMKRIEEKLWLLEGWALACETGGKP